ncbi:hypothetical protein RUM_01840 [Ruminococcus champanellensis 18P13 = JCM 17042]|uniref:Uncharacterized protein n=1 Tax=Ruminococcus champanellensis (strain DSM 18848 / JCM 17042 / KCTC 15320 / 18P13) TaxID=213810 RepID=D4L9Z3_RUMC1|nr:hypothetical protein RUM_01840 [Ruminococcus champanellensis 18P13 = JCM 17042]
MTILTSMISIIFGIQSKASTKKLRKTKIYIMTQIMV